MSKLSTFVATLGVAAASADIFTCSSGPASIVVADDYTYEFSFHETWLSDGDVALNWGNTTFSAKAGSLSPQSHAASSGSDAFGSFQGVQITWLAKAVAAYSIETWFKCYNSTSGTPFIAFQTVFPDGASDCTTAFQAGADVKASNLYNSSVAPITQFPSWAADNSTFLQSGSLSHIEWAGVFNWIDLNAGVGLQPLGTAASPQNGYGTKYVGGQTGGPVVLHDSTWSRGPNGAAPRAVFISPMDGFKHAILALQPGPTTASEARPQGDVTDGAAASLRWVFGPQGHLISIAPGTTFTLGFFPSTDGITASVYGGGEVLTSAYNTSRIGSGGDLGSRALSFYTDNGGFYEWDYWDQAAVLSQNTPAQTVFPAIRSSLPLAQSYQLDPWWYKLDDGGNNWGQNWTANTRIFGSEGLGPLVSAGFRFTLYSSYWAQANMTQMPPYTFIDSEVFPGWMALPISQITSNQSRAFHDMLVSRGLQWGMVGYETDFTDFNFMAFKQAQQTMGVYEAWLGGMDGALAAKGIPLQLCMGLPNDVLLSLQLQAVTSFRASQDDDPAYMPPTRWNIGVSSMLLAAVGLRPFFDVTWTAQRIPDPLNPFGPELTLNSTELGVAISLLSTGPVGIGDAAGWTNGSLVAATCKSSDGTLLKPDRPATVVDAYFGPQGFFTTQQAAVLQAPSFIPCSGIYCVQDATIGPNLIKDDFDHTYGHGQAARGPAPGPGAGAGDSGATAGGHVGTSDPDMWMPHMTLFVADAAENVTIWPSDLYVSQSHPSLASVSGPGTNISSFVALPWSPGFAAMQARCINPGFAPVPAGQCGLITFNESNPLVINTGGPQQTEGKGEAHHPFELYSIHPVSPTGFALLGELGKFVRVNRQRFASVTYNGWPAGGSIQVVVNCINENVTPLILIPTGMIQTPTFTCDVSHAQVTVYCDVNGCNIS